MAETDIAFTLSGAAYPARAGRTVVVQRQSGGSWTEVGRATQSLTGGYSVQTSAGSVGRITYRAVTPPWQEAAAVTSATRAVSVQAPSLLLKESTAIAAEEVSANGQLPGAYARPIAVQRRTGAGWVTLVEATTSSTGSYVTSFAAPSVGSYDVRVVAPKGTSARNARAEYVSSVKALSVVAQSASLSMPTTLVESAAGAATVTFGPVRVGRSVALQVERSGLWTAVATGEQSSTGATALTFTAGAPGSYSYRAWTAAANGAPAFASRVGVLEVTAAAALPSITGTVTEAGPTPHGLANVTVSVNSHSTGGYGSATTIANGTYSLSGLPAGTDYMVCFYGADATGGSSDALGYSRQCFDNVPMWGEPMGGNPTPVTVNAGATTTSVDAALVVGGAISGSVTEAGGTQRGLAKVRVSVSTPTNGNYYGDATTAADGSYTVKGMPAETDYQVCFLAADAAGGSTDALGYLDQCYDNQPTSGTPKPVVVTLGALSPGVDAALASAGAILGTVSDAGGTQHGLANVSVRVFSPSNGTYGNSTTLADGNYTVHGLAAATDYQVCFYASGAIGGSTDPTGYLDQCYDNQPISGTPTGVAVTLGASRVGVNAALAAGGAISGTVTEAGGTQHGLAGVWVMVASQSTGVNVPATTAADGSYTASGLAAGSDYTVCFMGFGSTGGASDALGYLDQCYDNQPTGDAATQVAVTLGESRAGVNAALAEAGAISGTVTEAGGTHHGLANVSVNVSSPSFGVKGGYAATAPDGSYIVIGLTPGADYRVCFSAAGATGGSSDALGYVDQCYDSQSTSDTALPVTVSAGETRTAVDAALGAIAP